MAVKLKDFFYYSKTDRGLLIAALGLLFVIVVLHLVLPSPPQEREGAGELSAFRQEVERAHSSRRDGKKRYTRKFDKKPSAYSRKASFTLAALRLHSFDPNEADSAELAAMGLPTTAVRSLVHYRQRGGEYRTAESVQRLYGMSDSLFVRLQPYLRLPEPQASPAVERYPVAEKYPAGTRIDLNTADTTQLKKIPGIGSGIARAIVGYRERLGGFYAVEQLAEVRYVTPQMYEWFMVEEPSLRPLRVNHDKLERLKSHPYLNYYQARDIIAERNARGDIKSLSRLSTYKDFTEKDFERLKPYLDFD
jgi:competence ComEA-like helix-hairpin-helix protein